MKTKLILFFISFFAISIFLATKTFAQTPKENLPVQNNPHSLPLNTNPDVPQNINTYTQSVFINILGTATCFVSGFDPLSVDGKCLGIEPTTKKIGYVENGSGGLFSLAGGLIGSTYNIPVSSVAYGRMVASNFGITHSTYAQTPEEICSGLPPETISQCLDHQRTGIGEGKGFASLTPVLNIWQMFRNIIYLLFVLIFIVLGLGIMFRVNIDARTVMTVQNQIPKIVIALILITLSYAIAGFLIDMMYVSMHLIINLMASQGLEVGTNVSTNPFNAFGGLGSIGGISGDAAGSVGSIISSLFDGTIGSVVQTMVITVVTTFIGSAAGGAIGSAAAPGASLLGFNPGQLIGSGVGLASGLLGSFFLGDKIVGYIATIIAFLIISIAILSVLFRVWFMLIKAYVYIMLDVILAPFWIVTGILPGVGGGFGPWFRSLLANLAAFPVVLFLFSLGRLIQQNFASEANRGGFVPPFIGDPGNMSAFGSLIGLGFILIMPEALSLTKQVLKAPDFKIAAAAMGAIKFGRKATGFIPGQIWSRATHQDPLHPEVGGFISQWASQHPTQSGAPFQGSQASARWRQLVRSVLRIRERQ